MLTFIKTLWASMKDRFTSQDKQTLVNHNSNDSDSSETNNIDTYVTINITPQDSLIPQKPHWPVFTVSIGLLDVFMLLVVYIVQEGTVLTSDTWIKMGCKYVPCMKPVYSKAEQEIYNAGLKSQCESFPFPYQFFRFFTPIFLHGGITHLLSNLVCQALTGAFLEGKYGTKTLGICYILFGCSGNIMSALCNPKSSK
jgi:membrane associated rhomboid family serine protease